MMALKTLEDVLQKARDRLHTWQLADGSWDRPVYNDARTTGFYLQGLQAMGRYDTFPVVPLELYLANSQLACGAWPALPEGVADPDVTAICAIALEQAQTREGREAGLKARDWLDSQPTPQLDAFWLGYFAFTGHLSYDEIPFCPTWIVSLPHWWHPNIYDIGVLKWGLIPLSIIQSGFACTAPHTKTRIPTAQWQSNWLASARRNFGRGPRLVNVLLKGVCALIGTPKHFEKAVQWLLGHVEEDGTFFSLVHMTIFSAHSLYCADADAHRAVIDRALRALETWQVDTPDGRAQGFCDSATWDTGHALRALEHMSKEDSAEAIARGSDFLISSQSFHVFDVEHKLVTRDRSYDPAKSGAWTFHRYGLYCPDADDTALAVMGVLTNWQNTPEQRRSVLSAFHWLWAMQDGKGAWASWSRGEKNWVKFLRGGAWFMYDPSCPFITARNVCLNAQLIARTYAGLEAHIPKARQAMQDGVAYLHASQEEDKWVCSWFVHYLAATCAAIEALCSAGEADSPSVKRAVRWLKSIAQEDGGYGESIGSFHAKQYVPAPSSTVHTASVLMCYVAAGEAGCPEAQQAAQWLIRRQEADGGWHDIDFFSSGVAGVWYCCYTGTATFYATLALSLYQEGLEARGPSAVQNG